MSSASRHRRPRRIPRRGNSKFPLPPGSRREMVTHFSIVATASGQSAETTPMTFLAPGEKK